MHILKKVVVLSAIIFSLFLVSNSTNVNANDFDDVQDVPYTSPIKP